MTKDEVYDTLYKWVNEGFCEVQDKLDAPGDMSPLLSLQYGKAVQEIADVCVEQLKGNGVIVK